MLTGDYYGKGRIRSKELYLSSQVLGISSMSLVEDPGLRDGPEPWSIDLISCVVDKYVRQHVIGTIITFDIHGVSGHPNHCDVSRGVQQLWSHWANGQRPEVFLLETTNIARKYSGLADMGTSWVLKHYQTLHSYDANSSEPQAVPELTFSSPLDFTLTVRAMLMHRSQMVWYRLLFLFFSRYSFVNTLNKLQDLGESTENAAHSSGESGSRVSKMSHRHGFDWDGSTAPFILYTDRKKSKIT